MKNQIASIQARLRNISRAERKDFVLVTRLYMQEGLLRRIGMSEYSDSFLLKGGLLLFSLSGFKGRPTKDIDLLGLNIPGNETQLLTIFDKILSIPVEDGLSFATATMILDGITQGADYRGQRLKVECHLGNIHTNLKVDIGFGDVIFPEPVQMDYPTLLESEPVAILAYSLESVIAEKFEAMVALDFRNSRMKDFYDIHDILTTRQIDSASLKEAVRLTFERRRTILPETPAIFQDVFAIDPRNEQLWQAFLNRIKADPIPLSEVLESITTHLLPIYQKMR